MAEIVVVGSVNMDLVATAPRLPAAGETLIGRNFMTVPGGKGANQAYGAGKLGGQTAMVGAVGADAFGEASAANLASTGVDVGSLRRIPGTPTGVALIVVDEAAQNSIVVIPGANADLTPDDLDSAASVFANAKVLLVQLEIPLLVVLRAMCLAKEHGASVILDPAPVCPLPNSLLALVDFLTPNQIEAEMLTGVHVVDRATACEAAGVLHRQGVGRVLVKLGAGGVVLLGEDWDGLCTRSPGGGRRYHGRGRCLQRRAGRGPGPGGARGGSRAFCQRRGGALGHTPGRAELDADCGRGERLPGGRKVKAVFLPAKNHPQTDKSLPRRGSTLTYCALA